MRQRLDGPLLLFNSHFILKLLRGIVKPSAKARYGSSENHDKKLLILNIRSISRSGLCTGPYLHLQLDSFGRSWHLILARFLIMGLSGAWTTDNASLPLALHHNSPCQLKSSVVKFLFFSLPDRPTNPQRQPHHPAAQHPPIPTTWVPKSL